VRIKQFSLAMASTAQSGDIIDMFPTRLSFITYNLWNTKRWPQREGALRHFFRKFLPDVFCLQELRAETRATLDDALPEYRRVQDAYLGWEVESNIYWNGDLLEEVVHGVEDIAIDTNEYRGLFWARLRVKATGSTLFVSTAHYTYQEHPNELESGQSPRLKQTHRTIQVLQERVQPNEPGFFMGDLNDPVVPGYFLTPAGYKSVFAALGLVPEPTWPAFPTAQETAFQRITTQSIDWIFANDRARPMSAGVPHFYHGDFTVSDHWPVQAIYQLES
jgi:endonuclease/exonuclease/phosphatase family metal-dependent hydrolase